MARNRLEAIIEDSSIAAVSEYAVQHHGGRFGEALEAIIAKGTAPAPKEPKPAKSAAKKSAAKKSAAKK